MVTFLFSDIEGSTARWEANPQAMASALARHDAVIRVALEAHGGHVFKTVGDAFCVAFPNAPDALAAALEAQRALGAEDFSSVGNLRVRIALHTGTAHERDGDYFGTTVNRVARLLAAGNGGQVLVSGACADAIRDNLPLQTGLRDLGAHRLKDLTDPEHVYQLLAPDLTASFPELRSLENLSNNLPRQLTSFVGRDGVVPEIAALTGTHPLVTIVGAGGVGKTRCAIQTGAELLDAYIDGVWLVELAPIPEPALTANAVARALNVKEQPNRPILDTLVTHLKRKRLLLILDNCEHVIDEVRRVAAAILRECPEVRVMATSREPLNIAGEAVYRMPSLAVPSGAESASIDAALRYGAVQLFIDRAASSDKRFTLTQDNAPDVAEICNRLDGIPLAIELAAARIRVLSPKQLVQKLDERFRVLTGGDRAALPRQQTMRALIDWSYDLLSNDERSLFRKLSIFAGGFTIEAATAVCKEGELDEIRVLDLLSSLVDKSLVQAEAAGDGTRYRLLESTRQYAREKLVEAGEAESVAHAHARAFVTLVEQLAEAWDDNMPDPDWLARAEPELENVRAALSWTLSTSGDVLLGQRIASVLRRGWWNALGLAESRRWVQAAHQGVTPDTPASVLAALDLAESALAGAFRQLKVSLSTGERALARCRELADPYGIATAQLQVGWAQVILGDFAEGEALLREALDTFRVLGTRRLVMVTLENLAAARLFADDLPGARKYYSEALAAARAAGAQQYAAQIAGNLAETEFRGGDADAALHSIQELLAAASGVRATAFDIVGARCNMTAYLVALHRFDEARAAGREAVGAASDTQSSVLLAFALQHLGAVSALRPSPTSFIEDRSRAARMLGFVDARITALGAVREYTEQQEYDAMISQLRDALGEGEFSRLMAEGSTWSEDLAVTEAMHI